MSFQPSPFQVKIFEWIQRAEQRLNTARTLVVQAKPGSGKTTTLVQGSEYIINKSSAIFVAFNKHIAEELQQKLPLRMSARTIHSLGYQAIGDYFGRRPQVKGNLHNLLIREWVASKRYELDLDNDEEKELKDEIKALINLCQLSLIDPSNEDAVWDGVRHYGIDVRFDIHPAIDAVKEILAKIKREARKHISYNEMVWLPIIENMALPKYKAVLADESQDFNRLQQTFLYRMVAPGGYGIFVGDENQALYGFAMASTSGMSDIVTERKAETLPLSICYRCPTSHIALANEIYPGMEARHNAPGGEIWDINDHDTGDKIKQGDLVLCRVNAPLIPLCFQLIREGINAQVKGRDIGQSLIKDLRKISKKYSINWEDPQIAFNEYKRDEEKKIRLTFRDDEEEAAMAIERLTDKVGCLVAIWEGSGCDSLPCMEDTIERLFADKDAAIWLSTIHKAKGLEADNVFILKPSIMPHPKARKSWEIVQENNMKYVAFTRAKNRLFFCWEQNEEGRPISLGLRNPTPQGAAILDTALSEHEELPVPVFSEEDEY
ncbi:hypothetical protein D0962_23470 [Leptolyngbyaceae cyanobacterium CCMR0082]|uniref:DNA 3'-5' helicase n=1 Tax=Adonisia turfae CCMR0082 TaxID=2304604 RepID=A0A6M0SB52_9CYAN|nr:UvrD-helicase domain-containing protein [Adonisia turfae]NEZ65680.1 hypothetical protein [Adonisia turfae CCMR0082]